MVLRLILGNQLRLIAKPSWFPATSKDWLGMCAWKLF